MFLCPKVINHSLWIIHNLKRKNNIFEANIYFYKYLSIRAKYYVCEERIPFLGNHIFEWTNHISEATKQFYWTEIVSPKEKTSCSSNIYVYIYIYIYIYIHHTYIYIIAFFILYLYTIYILSLNCSIISNRTYTLKYVHIYRRLHWIA